MLKNRCKWSQSSSSLPHTPTQPIPCKYKSLLPRQPLFMNFLLYFLKWSETSRVPSLVVLDALPSIARSFTKLCQMVWQTTPAPNALELWHLPFCTWKTVTMAQSKESKFFLSGSVSPSRSEANLQPKRCIPNMLQGGKAGAQQETTSLSY